MRVREARELITSMVVFYRTQFDKQLRNQINNAAVSNHGIGINGSNSNNNGSNKRHIVMRLIVGRGLHSIENKAVLGIPHPLQHAINMPYNTPCNPINTHCNPINTHCNPINAPYHTPSHTPSQHTISHTLSHTLSIGPALVEYLTQRNITHSYDPGGGEMEITIRPK